MSTDLQKGISFVKNLQYTLKLQLRVLQMMKEIVENKNSLKKEEIESIDNTLYQTIKANKYMIEDLQKMLNEGYKIN